MTNLNDLMDFMKAEFDSMKEILRTHEDSIKEVFNKQQLIIGEVNQVKNDVDTVKSTAKNNQQDVAELKEEISKLKMSQQDTKRRGSRRYNVFKNIFLN